MLEADLLAQMLPSLGPTGAVLGVGLMAARGFKRETRPNGGGSIRDQLNRIESRLGKIENKQGEHSTDLAVIKTQMIHGADRMDRHDRRIDALEQP